MGKKKCKCPPAGAPEWMVTYGDMVTLLLCFFVLIVSFSEIKKEDEFQAVVEEIQKAFGMKGGGGKLPTDTDPELSLIERLESIQLHQQKIPTRSNADDPGQEGRETTVQTVRPGMLYVVGGRITFEPGSAELTVDAQNQIMTLLQSEASPMGYNNIIEVRGHAAPLELESVGSEFSDLWSLSHARAKAVMDFMTSSGVGMRAERFRLIANADREPLAQRAYTAAGQEPNRRVEITVSDNLVKDFQEPESIGRN